MEKPIQSNMFKTSYLGHLPKRPISNRETLNTIYYAETASSLNKRPLGEIYKEGVKKKGGERSAL